MFFFLIVFSYEFASPVIQYEFECFRKTDSVFFFWRFSEGSQI